MCRSDWQSHPFCQVFSTPNGSFRAVSQLSYASRHCTLCHCRSRSPCATSTYDCTLVFAIFAAKGCLLGGNAILGAPTWRKLRNETFVNNKRTQQPRAAADIQAARMACPKGNHDRRQHHGASLTVSVFPGIRVSMAVPLSFISTAIYRASTTIRPSSIITPHWHGRASTAQ